MSEITNQDKIIADKDLYEFQMLYKKHFGIEITKEQALEKGLRLIRLIEIVCRTVSNEQKDAQISAPNPRRIP